MTDLIGTPFYFPPEVLKKEYCGASVDMWSFGVIIFMLLTGEPPFDADTPKLVIKEIEKQTAKPAEMKAMIIERLKVRVALC